MIATIVRDRQLKALIDKKGKTINVSYSEDGLKWTTSNTGKLVYYKNAKIKRSGDFLYIASSDGKPLEKSDEYKVVHYIPTDKPTYNQQLTEYAMASRAFRMLYTSYNNAVRTIP